MKKCTTTLGSLCLVLSLFLSGLPIHLNAQVVARRVVATTGDTVPFLRYTPAGHYAPGNTRKYPLIIFLHGGGERSDNVSLSAGSPVWNLQGFGPFQMITGSGAHKMNFTWNGKIDTFMVVSPMSRQHSRTAPYPQIYKWPVESVLAMIKYAYDSLKVDTNRIFLTGHSMGGGEGTFNYLNNTLANVKKLAAAAPVSPWNVQLNTTGRNNVVNAKLPLWAFHAKNDPTSNGDYTYTQNSINGVNALNPDVKALMTLWDTGVITSNPHSHAPLRVYHTISYPHGVDASGDEGALNIYEWFLGQNNDSLANVLPVADAGSDQSISTSPGTAVLDGSGSTDGVGILRYLWKQISGPAVSITNTYTTTIAAAATHKTKSISGLTTAGTYRFELTVVDTRAGMAKDTVEITVGAGTGKAVSITASTGRIATGDVAELRNATKFTLETRFKYDSTTETWTTLMRKSNTSSSPPLSDRIMLHIRNNNSIYVMVGNGSNSYGYTGVNAVSPGTWYHVAAVFDGTQTGNANRLKLYIDGVQQTLNFDGTVIPAITSNTNTAPFMAGGEPGCCYLHGAIDEIRVWNTALPVATISEWQNKQLGDCHPSIDSLVLYWPLDDNANPSIAAPALGTAYTGTITYGSYINSSQATAASDCTGKAVSITASTGRIATGDVTELRNATKFTLETRFKYDSTTETWTTLMRKSNTSSSPPLSDRIMLHIRNNNSIYVMVGNGSNSYGYTGVNAVSPGTWYHVAAVFDGTQTGNANRLKLYIDGVQQTLNFDGTVIPAITSNTNTAPFMAGGEPGCCYLHGAIDEVRVWNTALTVATITEWQNKQLGDCHPSIDSLVLYWPLDDNANPSIAAPALGTAYTGTITYGSYINSNQATTASGCGDARKSIRPPVGKTEENTLFAAKAYPNPTDGLMQIELHTPVAKPATIAVIDISGKSLYRHKRLLEKGNNKILLNITALPSGTYIIRVDDGKTMLRKYKVLKR